tara:strand:+ start:1644 stop:1979 length:336 start_codon:yes stop_codon:yes gene_type:complete
MAKITSHTLNGFDGTHASGITVQLRNTKNGSVIFSAEMDTGGRLSQDVSADHVDPGVSYELIFETGQYWARQGINAKTKEIALRFEMNDPDGAYHMPVIINPNAYSTWMSS